MHSSRVLVIDDDSSFALMLKLMIEDNHLECVVCSTLDEGVQAAANGDFGIVFLDVKMPDGNGLERISEIISSPSSPEVIIITGAGDADGAELAISNGAWDYIEKTSTTNRLSLTLTKALEYRKHRKTYSVHHLDRCGIVGESQAIKSCLEQVAMAASSDVGVLITGPTGSGKELFARAIHQNSSRSSQNHVIVDCASLTETLVESTLFGHEKGAYTGADKSSEGLIRQAHKGTLVLDEIGEMPLSMQKSFLRVLDNKSFRPVGGAKEMESDFRLIASTNRDLDQMISRQLFRKDLLYRLKTIHIELPPLKERVEDIEIIAEGYLNSKSKGTPPELSTEVLDIFKTYPWPGNVRELIHALDLAMASSAGTTVITSHHLPKMIRIHAARNSINGNRSTEPDSESVEKLPSYNDFKFRSTQNYLEKLIKSCRGSIPDALKVSGLSRSRLYALLQKHDIKHNK